MNKEAKISSLQLKGLMISTIIGVGILTLSNTLASISGKDGWIPILLTGLLLIPFVIMINKIFENNQGKDYFQIGREVLGNFIFSLFMIVFALYLAVVAAYVLRHLGELIKSFLLPTTPIKVTMAIFLITVVYISSYDIDVIARVGYLIYPVLIIFLVFLITIALPTAKITGLLPMLQSDFSKIPKGVMESFFSFTGFEILLFTLPYVEDKENSVKQSILSIVIVSLIYIGIFILALTQFSIFQIKRQNFPIIMVSKMVDLPGLFLQNLDTVFMAVWVMISFGTMGPVFYGSTLILQDVFKIKQRKYIVLALAPLVYLVAVLPKNILVLQDKLGLFLNISSTFSIVVVPTLIYIIGSIRRWPEK